MQRSPQGLSDVQSWREKLLSGRTTILNLVLSNSDTALYPTSIVLESVDGPRLSDHVMMVNNAKALTEIFTRSWYSGNPRPDLAVPVLLTQLLNLRKLDITVGISTYLTAIVTCIVSGKSHIHQKSLCSCCLPRILRGEQQYFMMSEEGALKERI